MSIEYLSAVQKSGEYNKETQLYLKKRVLVTIQKLIKTFFNRKIEKGEYILDLGTADGTFVEVAKESGFKSSGLDIDQVDLENQKINMKDESCDLIVANSLIEHIQNPSNFLREVKRILKKKAFFVLITPDWKYNMDIFYDDPTHVRPYTKESLEFLLDSYGFKNVKVVPWLVCKPTWMWKVPFSFVIGRLLPFTGSRNPLIPSFLKGKSKSLLVICTK